MSSSPAVGRLMDLHGDSASGKGGTTDTYEPPVQEAV